MDYCNQNHRATQTPENKGIHSPFKSLCVTFLEIKVFSLLWGPSFHLHASILTYNSSSKTLFCSFLSCPARSIGLLIFNFFTGIGPNSLSNTVLSKLQKIVWFGEFKRKDRWATSGAGTVNPFRASEFTPGF